MKKLILLLLFIPLVSFGQDITNLSLERTPIYQKKTEGVFYFKEGIFYAVSVANSGFTSIKKMTRQAEEQMENFAKNNKYKSVILYSNTVLQNSIHLYNKFGFKKIDNPDAPYERSDIKMEYILSDS